MAPNSLEGQTLGKYRVLEPLGQGGMAQVYRAYHAQLDRYVAIKVLRADLIEEEEFLGRFSREARSVASLRHPNIVQVFDFDVQDGVYYMVMELLHGNTLKAYLNRYHSRGETVPAADIAQILCDVLKGLAYAHNQGIIHRDLKPANILLTSQGEAVLTDFGIAQIVGGTQYTVAGALMGTLHYMAPEQALGKTVDARSDIYSLGVVLYELLSGHPPFDADTPLAILLKHLNDPLPLPSDPALRFPIPFERVVLKALAKQPDDRYQTADEMAGALQGAAREYETEIKAAPAAQRPVSANIPAAPEIPLVYSGAERKNITDQNFAADDTDMKIEQHLKTGGVLAAGGETSSTEPRAESSPAPQIAATAQADGSQAVLSDIYRAAGNLFVSVGSVVSGALNSAAEEVRQSTTQNHAQAGPAQVSAQQPMPGLIEVGKADIQPADGPAAKINIQPIPEQAPVNIQPIGVTRSALIGAGLLVGFNLFSIGTGITTGWWGLFTYGWPAELLLVSILLSLLMSALAQIWILIPAGIMMGTGLLLSFTSLFGTWKLWGVLWIPEGILVGGLIYWVVRTASSRPNTSRAMARLLGITMALVAGVAIIMLSLGSFTISTLHRLFSWF